jgi:hypothetical protein
MRRLIDNVDGPVIFGGDLNAVPERIEIQRITEKLGDAWNAAPQDRHDCGGSLQRIDYMFFRGPYIVRQYEAPCFPLNEVYLPKYEKQGCSLAGADLSDHSFTLVRFEVTGVTNTPPTPTPSECAAIKVSITGLEAEEARLSDMIAEIDDASNPRVTAALKAQRARVREQITNLRDRLAAFGCP